MTRARIRSVLDGNDQSEAPSSTVSRSVITQEQLAQYRDLCARSREQKAMRRELMDLLDAGATVASGSLSVEIREVTSRRLDFGRLSVLLGSDRAKELRAQVEPSVSRHLILHKLDVDEGRDATRQRFARDAAPHSWEEILGLGGPSETTAAKK